MTTTNIFSNKQSYLKYLACNGQYYPINLKDFLSSEIIKKGKYYYAVFFYPTTKIKIPLTVANNGNDTNWQLSFGQEDETLDNEYNEIYEITAPSNVIKLYNEIISNLLSLIEENGGNILDFKCDISLLE